MALPFLNGFRRKQRNQIISVDLGTRTTKAVLLEQRGEIWALARYALLDAPIFDKKISPEMLTEHLKNVVEALETEAKFVTLSVGLDDAVVRQVELPQIPIDEMRLVLKNNTKAYLQQDLPGHVFDCYVFPPRQDAAGKPAEAPKTTAVPKLKVLVTGAKQQMVSDFQAAIRSAGLVADYIIPGLVGPVNAFELALPQIFSGESVALVDIGFKHTSICVLDRGEMALTRVVNIGGDKVTAGLAEAMSITYAEAEGIKVGMAPEVQSSLEMQVLPLGRELRASLDFFEHQNDRAISQVYVSGGSARSEMILQILQAEMIVECKTWNPTAFLQLALPGQQAVEIEHIGSQLTVAIGAALATI
ncbi:MAG TPA: pilus assembly protein PilM [Candidatus Acidoferrales bacterium]|nr:pilus assembly protein PilM [Candidatus Acidoferrales bacterium]